jgi:hypothetical protein
MGRFIRSYKLHYSVTDGSTFYVIRFEFLTVKAKTNRIQVGF